MGFNSGFKGLTRQYNHMFRICQLLRKALASTEL